MNPILRQCDRTAFHLSAAAFTVAFLAVAVTLSNAGANTAHAASPCNVRDTCSGDPGRYADYRDNGPVKAREYVGEMRWGAGGAPDDVYVVTRTVGSRSFVGAKPCQVRDACVSGHEAPKVVRSGPNGPAIPTAKQIESVRASNQPAQN